MSLREKVGQLFNVRVESLVPGVEGSVTEGSDAMTDFFRLWKRIEDLHLSAPTGMKISYALYDGKFVRSLCAPNRDCTAEELAGAISEYIKLFDKLMKHYLTGRLDAQGVEAAYYSYMRGASVRI